MFLKQMKPEEFDAVYDLMKKSFPVDEYRPYEKQKELLSLPAFQIYVAKEEDSEDIKGFAAVWDFDWLVYIEHLAVNPAERNNGLGAKILKSIKEQSSVMVCLDVEKPDNEMARRRIGFYERNGFCFNDRLYLQPALAENQQPVPLYPMTAERTVTEDELEAIIAQLRKEVYRIR